MLPVLKSSLLVSESITDEEAYARQARVAWLLLLPLSLLLPRHARR